MWRCPSCGRWFAAKLLRTKGVNVFRFRFQKGDAPPSHVIRSAVAARLVLDENDVFVEMKSDTTATVALPKNVLPKGELVIWGWPGWSKDQDRTEKPMQVYERVLSDLWTGKREGIRSYLEQFGCKRCEHVWTELRIVYD